MTPPENDAKTTPEQRRELERRLEEAQVALRASEEEHRRTAESLRRSERELALIIERMPDGIVLRQGDQIVFANPAFARTLRYQEEELRDRRLGELVHPDDLTALLPAHATDNAVAAGEFRFV